MKTYNLFDLIASMRASNNGDHCQHVYHYRGWVYDMQAIARRIDCFLTSDYR
jgi:hypothetical protein